MKKTISWIFTLVFLVSFASVAYADSSPVAAITGEIIGAQIKLHVSATDDVGLANIKASYQGAWHDFNCNGAISCETDFYVTETAARTYEYKGRAEDTAGKRGFSLVSVDFNFFNSAPVIDSYLPADLNPSIMFGSYVDFSYTGHDPENNPLTYSWKVNNVEQSTAASWRFTPGSTGTYAVSLTVSDGSLTASQSWIVYAQTKDVFVSNTAAQSAAVEKQIFYINATINYTSIDNSNASTTARFLIDTGAGFVEKSSKPINITVNGSKAVSFNWTDDFSTTQAINMRISADKIIGEENTINNNATTSVNSVRIEDAYALSVRQATAYSSVTDGTTVTLNITLTNYANVPVYYVPVNITYIEPGLTFNTGGACADNLYTFLNVTALGSKKWYTSFFDQDPCVTAGVLNTSESADMITASIEGRISASNTIKNSYGRKIYHVNSVGSLLDTIGFGSYQVTGITTINALKFWITSMNKGRIFDITPLGILNTMYSSALFSTGTPKGITTIDGTNFWETTNTGSPHVAYKLDSSMNYISDFTTDTSGATDPYGITTANESIFWITDATLGKVFKVTDTGAYISNFSAKFLPNSTIKGIDTDDGSRLWVVDDANKLVFAVNETTSTQISNFSTESYATKPKGITTIDGNEFWIADDNVYEGDYGFS